MRDVLHYFVHFKHESMSMYSVIVVVALFWTEISMNRILVAFR